MRPRRAAAALRFGSALSPFVPFRRLACNVIALACVWYEDRPVYERIKRGALRIVHA